MKLLIILKILGTLSKSMSLSRTLTQKIQPAQSFDPYYLNDNATLGFQFHSFSNKLIDNLKNKASYVYNHCNEHCPVTHDHYVSPDVLVMLVYGTAPCSIILSWTF